jgi:hypothetical protein
MTEFDFVCVTASKHSLMSRLVHRLMEKMKHLIDNLHLQNTEQYMFQRNSSKGTVKQTYTTAYYTDSKHYGFETYYRSAKIKETCFRYLGYLIFIEIFRYLIIHDGTQTHNTDMDVILSFTHVKLGDMS